MHIIGYIMGEFWQALLERHLSNLLHSPCEYLAMKWENSCKEVLERICQNTVLV